RRGRTWHSPPGGLYLSAVLRPKSGVHIVPLMAGLAVAETIRAAAGLEARLKWPNDVLLCGKKVGGVIAESAWHRDGLGFTVLGIGVNINGLLPPTLREATTLSSELGEEVDVNRFLDTLLGRLDWYQGLLETDPTLILGAWRGLSSTLGRSVEVVADSGEMIRGVAVDVDREGALIVEAGGGRRRVVSGSLRGATIKF
ncbi:MAG: biotin--[acetyl-CoA-carboxylase] ligase, partial [Candidatus Bathyarchaeia archaeon]